MSVERSASRLEGVPVGISSRFADANGIRTHYLECGEPGAPPVVLIHGGGAGASAMGNWRGTMPAFSRQRRVIAVEMLGFGETDKPDGDFQYSQPARNAHLAAFLAALDLGPVPLVGNSMGGATALGVAMERPELVSALVLMGSAGLNATITPALAPILRYDFTFEGMRRLIDGLTGPRFTAGDDIVRSRYEDSIRPDARRAYQAAMTWIAGQGGLFYDEDRIASVKAETLVVNGKHDRVVPLSCAYRFLELLENSRGYIVPHCGHWVMIEAPDEFAEVVLQFLARLGRVS